MSTTLLQVEPVVVHHCEQSQAEIHTLRCVGEIDIQTVRLFDEWIHREVAHLWENITETDDEAQPSIRVVLCFEGIRYFASEGVHALRRLWHEVRAKRPDLKLGLVNVQPTTRRVLDVVRVPFCTDGIHLWLN